MKNNKNENNELEKELIKKIKRDNCNESLKQLAEMHTPLCMLMVRKYINTLSNSSFSLEDFEKEIFLLVYDCAKSFDLRYKVKFSTHLANNVRYYCLNYIHKSSKYVLQEPEKLNFQIENKQIEKEETNKQETLEYIHHILGQISDIRIKSIYDMRYDSNRRKCRPWSEIAKKMGMSTQQVINLHDKTLKILKNKLKSDVEIDKI